MGSRLTGIHFDVDISVQITYYACVDVSAKIKAVPRHSSGLNALLQMLTTELDKARQAAIKGLFVCLSYCYIFNSNFLTYLS